MNQAFSIIDSPVRGLPTKRRRTADQRTGVSTVETSLVIAMILGGLLVLIGTMSQGVTEMVKPANYALDLRERVVDPVKQPNASGRSPAVVDNQTNADPAPDASLIVGLGIPTAVLGLVAGTAYFFFKW
jgi:hypothetical protein